ncbi:Uncharacterised protein [Achromobacter spanius]|nr:hypothetical protein LMG5911_04514 [Achromobacter spanius]SPT37753.1 Uncharacterised protein [Achromobacter denitrificans]VEE56040.1 Uncharacterised protein [Achromobacter spanius]
MRVKKEAPVRIQWDPDRDLILQPLPYRTIQIGLSNEAVQLYVNQWIYRIRDVTPLVREIHALVDDKQFAEATRRLPAEHAYQYLDI